MLVSDTFGAAEARELFSTPALAQADNGQLHLVGTVDTLRKLPWQCP